MAKRYARRGRARTFWRIREEFRNWTIPASQIRNPKFQIGRVQLKISDFGFEMQESSNFKIPLIGFPHAGAGRVLHA
jgi:hypothetical protein